MFNYNDDTIGGIYINNYVQMNLFNDEIYSYYKNLKIRMKYYLLIMILKI